jgi:YD repeat-containing protein
VLLALLAGAALALPPAVLGPDGPLWVGPLVPRSGLSGSTQGAGPFVVIEPTTGALWVEEHLPDGALRVWSEGAWRLNGTPLTEELGEVGHRFAEGRLVSAPGAQGAVVHFGYDDDERLASIRWPNGATLGVSYGDDGRVSSTSGPGPGVWRFGWGEALTVRDPLGRSVSIRTEESEDQRVLTIKDAVGRTLRSRYSAKAGGGWQLTGWKDPRGLDTRIRRKAQQLEVQDPAGRVWRVRTDEGARVVQVTMPGGQRWVWQRDAAGRVRRIDDPAGRVSRWERDDTGQVVAVIRGGHQTRYRRDDSGRVSAVVSSSGGTTAIIRDDEGRVTSIRDSAGNPVFFERHENGLPSSVLGRTGARWTIGLDLLGRPARFEDPSGVVHTLYRGAAGLISRLEHPVFGTTVLEYGQDRRLARVVDGSKRQLKMSWDGAGRMTKIEAPGQVLELRHDPAGDVVAILRGGERVQIQRDPTGLPILAGDVRWTRDLNGRVVGLEQPGRKLGLDRDPAGWLRGVRAGEWELDIHRDGVGWPVGWSGTDGTLELVRDSAGRIAKEIGERTLRLSRGGRGEVARVSGPLGEWRWLRDAAGRVLRVHAGDGANIGLDRDTAGRVVLVRLPSGALMRRAYLPDGVTETITDPGGVQLDQRTTRFDGSGRLASVSNEAGQGWTWQRNGAGQLGSVSNSSGKSWLLGPEQHIGPAGEFMLLGEGGRVAEVQLPAVSQIWGQQTAQLSLHRGALGQLLYLTGDEGQSQLTHDAIGRLSAVRLPDGRSWTLSYDVRGRPAVVVDPEGHSHTLIWNPAVDAPGPTDLLQVQSSTGDLRFVRGSDGSGIVLGRTGVELIVTADGEPAWRFESGQAPEPLSASPHGLGAGPQLRWFGTGGRLQFFPGGPLLQGHVSVDPLSGERTGSARPWPWATPTLRASSTDPRTDPSAWSPKSPWSAPLRLLTAMGELAPIDDGRWWEPPGDPLAVSWLPASLDDAAPPLGVAAHSLPIGAMDPITSAWLRLVLSGESEPDLSLPIREVLRQEIQLPWLPPGLEIPGMQGLLEDPAGSKP